MAINPTGTLLSTLNEEQQAAAVHTGGPAVVLAGAGSGKTTVLTARIQWLITEQNQAPHNILVVTFTNKAAKEISQRILAGTQKRLPFSGTFHSFCAKVLRIDGIHVGLPQNFLIYDAQDQTSILKDIYKKKNINDEQLPLKAVQAAISSAKNELITAQEYASMARGQFQQQVAEVYNAYQQALSRAQSVDFDDLLLKTILLLKNNEIIRTKYQQMFTHVLVDEYQDTNTAQYALTTLLAQPHNNLFVVGDFCQSIYAWRGADYKNMLELKKKFPDITEYKLEQNYRSNQNILTAATQVISHNTMHPILALWTDQGDGEKITYIQTQSGAEEAQQVISRAKEIGRTTPLDDIAILYRTNAQSRILEEACIRAGLPYQLIGGTKFYERKEVKDVLAYLRYAVIPTDSVSLERITKLGVRRLAKFTEWLSKANQTQLHQNDPKTTLTEILETTNYLEKYKRKTEENSDRISNIEELVSVAAQFSSTTEFLENVALIQNAEFIAGKPSEEAEPSVKLMSLHAAKGLEFSTVFLVGMEEGLLPHSRSLMDPEQMEEERRLCYVGITRAKNKLFLASTSSRMQYGALIPSTPSRFIMHIDPSLLEITGVQRTKKNYMTSNPYQQTQQKEVKKAGRRIVVDDDIIAGVLNGEFDVDTLINS